MAIKISNNAEYAPTNRLRFYYEKFFDNYYGAEALGVPQLPKRSDIPQSNVDTLWKIDADHAYRLDKISYRFYGDYNLGWVILVANGLSDPIRDLTPGLTLRIPSKTALLGDII